MKVYVLVKVTYDYYRFQYNHGVFKTINEAEKYAKDKADYDVLCYNDNYDENMDNREKEHWCIQEFYCV